MRFTRLIPGQKTYLTQAITELQNIWTGSTVIDVTAMTGSDFGTKFNRAAARLGSTGGTLLIPPGTYTATTQPLLDLGSNEWKKVRILGYGAKLLTSGAIYAMHLASGATNSYVILEGLSIEHTGNLTALGGILAENSQLTQIRNVTINHDNAASSVATYAAVRFRNSTEGNNGTGAILPLIDGLHVRKSGDNDMPIGAVFEGACNGAIIRNSQIADCDDCILIQNQGSGTYWPNGLLIDGVRFENSTRCVKIAAQNSAKIIPSTGPRIVNCRAEGSSSTFLTISGFSYTAATISFTASTKTIADSGNGFPVMSAGIFITISGSASNNGRYTVASTSSASAIVVGETLVDESAGASVKLVWHPQEPIVIQNLTNVGVTLLSNVDSVDVAVIQSNTVSVMGSINAGLYGSSIVNGRIYSNATPIVDENMAIRNALAIGKTNTAGNNLNGQLAISETNTTATYTFSTAETNSSYFLSLTAVASTGTPAAGSNRILSIAKNAASFVITVEAAPGAGNSVTFDWLLTR